MERLIRNYILTVLFFIVLGFLLILLKIYELLIVFLVIMYVVLYIYRKRKEISTWGELLDLMMVWVYDFADGLVHPKKLFIDWVKKKNDHYKRVLINNLSYRWNWGYFSLIIVIFLTAAYLRFYDTLHYPAPAMSDSYVVIAWIKYLDSKLLFHDGIYPQGFHLYLNFLHKFSNLDPLYIVNYSGPLHGVFITLGLYFAVSRWTKRRGPGILAAVIYGILGSQLSLGWMRQAATNSQEYALVFVFPALYFFSNYITKGKRMDFITGTAAVFLIGLVHSLAFALAGLGMGVLLFLTILYGWRKNAKKIMRIIGAGIASIIVSITPVGIGLLMGKSFYGSSAEYLVSKDLEPTVPELHLVEYLAIAALIILVLYQFIKWKKHQELLAARFIVLFGICVLGLYYYGGVVTKSIVVSSRAGELWGLTAPVVLGMGWYGLSELLTPLKYKGTELFLGFCLLGYIFLIFRPQPIVPYKMEYESGVEQYLRISSMFNQSGWMIVSQEEGYALSLGKGYHLMMGDFLRMFNPREDKFEGCPPNIFIYHEKKVFRANRESSLYDQREKENQELKKWLELYENTHDNITTFYEDENLRIVRIHQVLDQEVRFETIWGSL